MKTLNQKKTGDALILDVALPHEIALDVEGMTCASCVLRVEKALLKVPGVSGAEVSLPSESAIVHLNHGIGTELLLQAVKNAGYSASVVKAGGNPMETLGKEDSSKFIELVIAVSLSILVISMSMLVKSPSILVGTFLLIFSTAIVFGFGRDIWRGAFAGAKQLSPSMDVLIALGSGAAWASGTYQFAMRSGMSSDFEPAVAIIGFQLIGRYLEMGARGKMTSSLQALLKLTPLSAQKILNDGSEVQVRVDELLPGDHVRVRPGEQIAADGVVFAGESEVDESMLTGEALPVEKVISSPVFQGSLNSAGSLEFIVERAGKGATIDRITTAIRHAQASKAPVQKLADKITAIFVPAVILVSIATFLGYWFTGFGGEHSLLVAISVVIVACPCALGLATPAAIAVSSGSAARLGVLFRDATTIEATSSVKHIIFDKTGTLTKGKPVLVDSISIGTSKDVALQIAAAAELPSEHAFGKAIVAAFTKSHPSEIVRAQDFISFGGRGIKGTVEGKQVLIGTHKFISEYKKAIPEELITWASNQEELGRTAVLMSFGGIAEFAGFSLEDELREESKGVIDRLVSEGFGVEILTGDSEAVAQSVGERLGIEEITARVLPEQKAKVVSARQVKLPTAMVGDGVNDGPALATAQVGIAMGSGADTALGAAGIALLMNDLNGVPIALRLARKTMNTIRWNLVWAMGYNIVMVPFAISGRLDPMWASAAMAVSSLMVVGNSLRLRSAV